MGCRTFFSRNIGPALVSWFLLLAISALYLIFVCWEFSQNHGYIIIILQLILLFYVISNFARATFMDPGYLPRGMPSDLSIVQIGVPGEKVMSNDKTSPPRPLMYKTVQINGVSTRLKWCVTCEIYRLPRCSHCSICKHCIDVGNVILILVGLIFIPVVGLTGFHIYLVFNGLTTNEQVTSKYGDNHSPFDRGPCSNCAFMCCRPLGAILIRKPVTGAAMQLSLQAKYRQKMRRSHKNSRIKGVNGKANAYSGVTRTTNSDPQPPVLMSELTNRLDGDTNASPKDLLLRLNNEENSLAQVPSFSLTDKREDSQYPNANYQGGSVPYPDNLPGGFSYRAPEKPTEVNPGESTGRIFSCKHLTEDRPTQAGHQTSRSQMDYSTSVVYSMQANAPLVPPHLPNRSTSIPKLRQPPLVVSKTANAPPSSSSRLKAFDESPRIEAPSSRHRQQQQQQQQPQHIPTSAYAGGGVLPKYPAKQAPNATQSMNTRTPSRDKRLHHYTPRQPGYGGPVTSEGYFVSQQPQNLREYHFAQQPPRGNPAIISSEEAPDGTFEISV
ncbi:Palmitoyltransferase ZDHHC8 [Taenia solium]|eukprot:TsM_000293100 transcript=TsM_000293100 gene=TsM_000293100